MRLKADGNFNSHLGHFRHDVLIGQLEGARVETSKGHWMLAVKPTMADFTREMPRIATIVYPKDLGAVVVYGDLFPGARVLEAGSGSGALTMAIARAVGRDGMVVSYDLREDMTERARENVAYMLPDHSWVTFKKGDVYEGFEETELDRVVLDLPEPCTWYPTRCGRWSPAASSRLRANGRAVPRGHARAQGRALVRADRDVGDSDASVGGLRRSVRPSHRMVGHTGFITTPASARRDRPRTTTKPTSSRADTGGATPEE